MKMSLEMDVTMLEAGLTHILKYPINKVDQNVVVEGLQSLASKLGTEESEQGHLLLVGIIEALDDPESFWKLTLSHRGKGEALSIDETAKRFAKDAAVALYVDALIEDGLTKESACIVAEGEFGIKPSTVKAMIKRAKKRATKESN
ncbi:MAG: hypothetical protein ABJN65_07065 [Parasphingorhabdus sp.]